MNPAPPVTSTRLVIGRRTLPRPRATKIGVAIMPPVHKWWHKDRNTASVQELESQLATINAAAPIAIEVAGRTPTPASSGNHGVPAEASVNKQFLREGHHRQYGRPWALGKYIFDFMLESGLEPG